MLSLWECAERTCIFPTVFLSVPFICATLSLGQNCKTSVKRALFVCLAACVFLSFFSVFSPLLSPILTESRFLSLCLIRGRFILLVKVVSLRASMYMDLCKMLLGVKLKMTQLKTFTNSHSSGTRTLQNICIFCGQILNYPEKVCHASIR